MFLLTVALFLALVIVTVSSTHLHCGTLCHAVLSWSLVLSYEVKWYPQVFSVQRAKRYGGFGAVGLCRPVLLVLYYLPACK